MDLSEVDDCIPFDLLLAKLEGYGFDKTSLRLSNSIIKYQVWFRNFFNWFIVNSLKGGLWNLRQFFCNWKPYKNDEKRGFFMLKALLFSRCLNFCLSFLILWKNSLLRKLWLISKFMMLQTRQQNNYST